MAGNRKVELKSPSKTGDELVAVADQNRAMTIGFEIVPTLQDLRIKTTTQFS